MYDLQNLEFKQLLKEYRKSRGFTLESLGNKIGKSKATVSKYETGEITPDIITMLEICNVLDINVSQLFPIKFTNNRLHLLKNPFTTNKLFLYYYTKSFLVTSILEIHEETNKIFVKLYNGIKNTSNYANKASYYYEGILECNKSIGYINLYNPNSNDIQLEKVQICFNIPWSNNFKITNFFILGLTPNSLPIIKKGILSTFPIENISSYKNLLKLTKDDITSIQEENAWILQNSNYDYLFFDN